MELTPEQTAVLNTLEEVYGAETPSYGADSYNPETIKGYIDYGVAHLLTWYAAHKLVTDPEYQEKKHAREEAARIKREQSAEANRDSLIQGWIAQLVPKINRAYRDSQVTFTVHEGDAVVEVYTNHELVLEVQYDNVARSLRTDLGTVGTTEKVGLVHGSSSPYDSFEGLRMLRDHLNERVAAQADTV